MIWNEEHILFRFNIYKATQPYAFELNFVKLDGSKWIHFVF